jgi:uncharacterized membrane protein
MNSFNKKRTIFFAAFLLIFLFSLPKLSQYGFMFSEYLTEQPKINYLLALVMSMVGFMNCYLQLTTDKQFNVNRAIRDYVAFGLGMSGIYYLVYISHLDCFRLPSDIAENVSVIDFIYFSFITVTTVGYGDIVPRHTFVRALVLFQVLFSVVLILRISSATSRSD